MVLKDINTALRNIIIKLLSNSWSKSNIGKLLFGPNGQSQLNYLLQTDNNEYCNLIGYKPISKIAKQLGYESHIIFVKEDAPRKYFDNIQEQNLAFINELESKLIERLTDETQAPKQIRASRGSNVNTLIDLLLDIKNKEENSDDE